MRIFAEKSSGHLMEVEAVQDTETRCHALGGCPLKTDPPCVTEDCSSMESKDAEDPGKHTNAPLARHKRKKKAGTVQTPPAGHRRHRLLRQCTFSGSARPRDLQADLRDAFLNHIAHSSSICHDTLWGRLPRAQRNGSEFEGRRSL